MKLLKKFLVWLGLRSQCCGAKIIYNAGWGREYCSKCGEKIS